MDNVLTFKPKNKFEGMRPATEGENPMPHILQAYGELRELVEAGRVEGLIIMGVDTSGNAFGNVAGLMHPLMVAGWLESVKIQLLGS